MTVDGAIDVFTSDAKGVQQTSVRAANIKTVMTLLATGNGRSSAEVARLSGLGAQTVSRIVAELEAGGYVRRGDRVRGRRGQPATPLHLVDAGAFTLGCEVGWRHAAMVLHDMGGHILGSLTEDYARLDSATVGPVILRMAAALTERIPGRARPRLRAIGLSLPDHDDPSASVQGGKARRWPPDDLAGTIGAELGLEVMLFNDGDAACWSELIAQPAPRPANFAYFLVTSHLASGVISKSRLWEGRSRSGANLGAVLICDRHGGTRLLDEIASIDALAERLISARITVPPGNPEKWAVDTMEPIMGAWIDDAGAALAQAIANVAVVADLGRAVIDAVLPRPIVMRLVEATRHYLIELPRGHADKPAVEMGHLGSLAPAFGAAQLPLYRKYFDRTITDFPP